MAVYGKPVVYSVVQLVLLLPCLLGFNLDTRIPVIKNGPQLNSLFGYSVAEHQIYNVDDGSVAENLFLVGAPKADVDAQRYTQQKDLVVTTVTGFGSLYKCRLSTNPDDCERLKLGEEIYQDTDRVKENVTDQWLGVVVNSEGPENKIITCAHRYKKHRTASQRTNWGFGKCHTFTNRLDYDMEWDACSQLSVVAGHEDYGYCQAGTSGIIANDGNVVIGAPGAKTWTGMLFKKYDTEELISGLGWKRTPVEKGENPPVPFFSYLGFSAAAGRFSGAQMYYAAGAPRANEIGQVVMFTAKTNNGEFQYIPENVIKGSVFGSMFGYDIIALDINQDGFDDLVVGAPFYFVKKKNVGGAIYVYMGGPQGIESSTIPTVIESRMMGEKECKRLGCTFARFGFSLTSAGDLNKDGYLDVAVGAPYEGNGTVYIFHGSEKGIVEKYAQRISADNITQTNLQAFGSSLSGGKDLDNNGYPDLAIGAFESENAVVLRARPVITLKPTIRASPKKINPTGEAYCRHDGSKKRCIAMEVCLQFETDYPNRFQSAIRVIYKIEADKFIGAITSRVDFKSPTNPQTPYFVEKEMTIDKTTPAPGDCQTELVYLKDVFSDKLRPIQFRVTYRLPERQVPSLSATSALPDINNYPILKPGPTNDLQVDLVKECGTDEICNSDLDLDVLILLTQDTQGARLPILSVGSQEDMNIRVSIRNPQEPAYETKFFITIPETVEFLGMHDPENTPVTCAYYNTTIVECPNIGNPFLQDASIDFTMLFKTEKVETTHGNFVIFAFVNTTSDEMDTQNNYYRQEVKVTARMDMFVTGSALPEQVVYSGSIRGETDIEYEDEIGPAVMHDYLVVNNGPSDVPYSTLYILWPYEMESDYNSGKHLLYLMEVPTATKGIAKDTVTCHVDAAIINPIGAKTREDAPPAVLDSEEPTTRKRRSASEEPGISKRQSGNEKSKKIVTLDCDHESARCRRITCNIGALGREEDVTITVKARLWESSFLQDYTNVDEVRIRSKGEISIDPKLNIEQATRDNDVDYAQTVAIPDVQIAEPTGELKWWIILVAVLGGIILLGLLILLLWKLGFFKRKKHEEMELHEAHLEKQKNHETDA
ncbi:integrin alpha-PS1-like [Liolophura sinensis]|uniref:integrin alpha-PS1-like n=1 Tax=Liolophura sinensis TaxID=3198878 RepID=UPI0031584E4D